MAGVAILGALALAVVPNRAAHRPVYHIID